MSVSFLLPESEYKRDLDFIKYYYKDATTFLAKMRGLSLEEADSFMKSLTSPQGAYPFYDPRVMLLNSESEGNRVLQESTMNGFLQTVSQKRYTMACTFTCYNHPDDKKSPSAAYAEQEMAHRNVNKGLMKKYEQQSEFKKANIYKNRQNRNKIKVNSISGGHGTKSSILFKASAHSTLTTWCRSGTQNTNSLLEKFLTGNRHYFDSATCLNNIISILNITDLDLVENAMSAYGLVYPSADYVKSYIMRSTDLYWESSVETKMINDLIDTLEPVELAAYLYVGDLWALKELNGDFVRKLVGDLHQPDYNNKVEDPGQWLSALSGDDAALLGIVANKELEGRKQSDPDVVSDGDIYGILGATAKKILDTLTDITDLAKAFWFTQNMPPSNARFPNSIRRCVIASDTDSAIFTNQDWVNWFVGEVGYDHTCSSVAAVTTYLSSLVTDHMLRMMGANLGAAKQHLSEFQMKNEYAFPFFSLTTMAKHYFAAMASKEGIVYKEYKWEIKGAQLKNSNSPKEFVERAEEVIKEIATTVMRGEELDAVAYLKEFAQREKALISAITGGSTHFFGRARIKPRDSYSDTATHSPYDHYDLWQTVFAPKYGEASAPPYAAVRVNINTTTTTRFNDWVDEMDDQVLAERFRIWMAERNKKQMRSLLLPVDIISAKGIPIEIVSAMDIRGMTMKLMRTFYLIAETFCVFMLNTNNTRMLSDYYEGEYEELKDE